MKRRHFFQYLGLGAAGSLLRPQWLQARPASPYRASGQLSLAEATNAQGELTLRLACDGPQNELVPLRLRLRGPATLARSDGYDFARGTALAFSPQGKWQETSLLPGHVWTLWFTGEAAESSLEFTLGGETHRIALPALAEKPEFTFSAGENTLTLNLLGHRETGSLDPADLGITAAGDRFRFAILADPQGGNPAYDGKGDTTRMKIHNAMVTESVALVNELDPPPVFSLVLGDFTDHQGEAEHFREMEKLFQPLRSPLFLAIGNHESAYRSDFGPGYNFEAFAEYFASQQRLNGIDKLLYAFDLGQWHFIVWPDPLRRGFWEAHPHYFDWLRRDLAKNKDRPVIFFQHVPSHPIGIDPLLAYVETVAVRRRVVDLLATHGNVRWAFSGHVHIPVKASLKTATELRGIKMLNLPAAGYRPRAFGEPDFFGGPEQGVTVVEVQGENVTVTAHTVTRRQFTFPDRFEPFAESRYPLWLGQPWELPLQDELQNGDFSQGLDHWHRRFVYQEDEAPTHVCETRQRGMQQVLWQHSRQRGYPAPGQDRMPQILNRLCQAVRVGEEVKGLRLRYRLPEAHWRPGTFNGVYAWLAYYRGSESVANLVYSAGRIYYNLASQFGNSRAAKVQHFDLPDTPGRWWVHELDPLRDAAQGESGRDLQALQPDRLVLHLGAWTINDGHAQEAAWEVDEVALIPAPGVAATPKPETALYYGGVKHVAGEHQLGTQAALYGEMRDEK